MALSPLLFAKPPAEILLIRPCKSPATNQPRRTSAHSATKSLNTTSIASDFSRRSASGAPNLALTGTTFVERFNATLRTFCHRYIRRTYGVSKDPTYHQYAVALQMVAHNFCRVHRTLRVTPAMEAGLTDHIWGVDELLKLIRQF